MPEPKRPLKVFLCHASTDKPKVRELYRYLKRRGIQPWFDEEDLVGGQDWQVEIPKALATSDAILICLTKNSVDKEGYIQKEIKFALDKALEMPDGKIFLIPVKFEECEVPFTLSRYQWVDLTIEAGYSKMMKALRFRASQLERITVELSKGDVEEEKSERERREQEESDKIAKEKVAREKAEHDAAEKIEKEIPDQAGIMPNGSLSSIGTSLKSGLVPTRPLFWGIGVIFIIFIGWFAIKPIFSSLPTATPNTTNTPISLTKTHTPTATRTHLPTRTPSFTPTPVPTSSILLQEDFEDNAAQGWWAWNENMTKKRQPKWTIDLEAGGNHYASISGDPKGTTIWYGDRTLTWIDYVFESRINFVNSAILDIYAHADGGDAQYAITMDNLGNIVFAQFHAPIYAELHRGPSIVFAQNRWYMLRLEISGNLLSIYVDNSLVKAQELPAPLINPQGGIGYTVTGGKFFIDDIKVWLLK